MAFNAQTSISLSYQPGTDLSQNQFQFVRLGSDNYLYPADSTTYPLGILANQPSAGAQGQFSGTVDMVGVSRLCVYGVYPVGTWLMAGSDGTTKGLGMSYTDASTTNSGTANNCYIRARALQSSTAAYDVISVQLVDPAPGVSSTGNLGVS
jgi:hypothetical protein